MNANMLGRFSRPDPRDAKYPMSLELAPGWVIPVNAHARKWKLGAILNQGLTPHCVGFAGAQWAQTSPVRSVLRKDFNGDEIYADCKQVDGYPTEDGSDAHALMKVLAAEGKIATSGGYFWATTPLEFAQWLYTKTPILCGTPWYNSMFQPDADGRVTPGGGGIAGGHEYLAYSIQISHVDILRSTIWFANSWGDGWGDGGRFHMSLGDFWGLIEKGGDAVAAIQTAK